MKRIRELKYIWNIAKTIYSGHAVIANMVVADSIRVSDKIVDVTVYNLTFDPKNKIYISLRNVEEQICTTKCRTKACTNAKHL